MPPRNTEPAQLRVLKIIEALFHAVLDGMSNSEVAAATGYSPSNVSRDMDVLCQAGWVQKMGNGRWALTTRPVTLMRFYQLYMAEFTERSSTFDARVTAQARQMMP